MVWTTKEVARPDGRRMVATIIVMYRPIDAHRTAAGTLSTETGGAAWVLNCIGDRAPAVSGSGCRPGSSVRTSNAPPGHAGRPQGPVGAPPLEPTASERSIPTAVSAARAPVFAYMPMRSWSVPPRHLPLRRGLPRWRQHRQRYRSDFMFADPHFPNSNLCRPDRKWPRAVTSLQLAKKISKLVLDHRALISRALDEWAEPEPGMYTTPSRPTDAKPQGSPIACGCCALSCRSSSSMTLSTSTRCVAPFGDVSEIE
jgi:hypothetical protein